MSQILARCEGGPLGGQTVTIRSGDGFLAANADVDRAWMYTRHPDGVYRVCTDHDNSLIYERGVTTGERRLDWNRMPLSTSGLEVVLIGSSEEAHAGDPVDDGWGSAGGGLT